MVLGVPVKSLFIQTPRASVPFSCLLCYNYSFVRFSDVSRINHEGDLIGGNFNVHVIVRDNNVDQALKALKKKMQREGMWREMKRRRSYEKPSEARARKKAEAVARLRKLERKRLQREGF